MIKRYRPLFFPILVAMLLGVALLVHVIQVRGQTTTTVDDTTTGTGQNQFNFVGAGWQHGGCTECYGSSNSWDNSVNDSVTVTFTGTQINFYGVKDPRHGQGAVSIDGGAETTVDFYAATRAGNQLLWSSAVLSNGAHTFKLRVTGNKNASAANTWVVPDRVDIIGGTVSPTATAASSTTTVNDMTAGTGQNQFNYVGAWQHGDCGECYNSDNSWDNTVNDSVTVTFTGTQINFYGVKDPSHGQGAVSIDGGAETTVDFYAATRAGNSLIWPSPVLTSGTHTFKLRVTGNKNASAANTWVVPDRVDIISGSGSATATPTKTNTPVPSNTAVPTSTAAVPTNTGTPSGGTDGSPYGSTAPNLPGTVEAENYNTGGEGVAYHDTTTTNDGGAYRTSEGVDLETCGDTGCGYDIGYVGMGEWAKYTVNVTTGGTYAANFRVASDIAGGNFHLEVDGTNVTGTMSVPNTGGWQTYTTLTKMGISLTAGQHVLRLVTDAVYANYNWFSITSSVVPTNTPSGGANGNPYGGTAPNLPGTIQAENYNTGGEGVAYHDTTTGNDGGAYRTTEAIDLETCGDTGGGYDIGYVASGEWTKYTVNVTSAGTYTATFRIASATTGGSFHLEVDGTDVTGAMSVPNTGGWQTYTTLTKTGISLTAGQHVLRLVSDVSGANYNWMSFATPATAWQNNTFNVDVANVVAQSNIILNHANTTDNQAMPLGNGTLGVALWSANGMTVQLNRVDTFPDRKSPGWLVIPGLTTLTGGAGYSGKVDLYNATFTESGGGMTATAYVLQNKDELIVDVTGANPNVTQTAKIQLWTGRTPTASASGAFATLAETFTDDSAEGASWQTFGTLAGITAGGRNVTASVVNSTTIQVSVLPNTDGSFRIVVAAPSYNGSQNAMTTVQNLIGSDATTAASTLRSTHLTWWHNFWAKDVIKMSSSDGQAAYIQNIRDLNFYLQAASQSGQFPGHHAGVADMFTWRQDSVDWNGALFWHWNLRMFTASNITAGHPELNTPYFNLYTSNLANIQTWTQQKFSQGDGSNVCVPETMRFNGNGTDDGGGGHTCDPSNSPNYNALTLSTGAEVSLWIWNQYLYTKDFSFLQNNYPIMAASARFYLAYATTGGDGKLHTYPTNAHENLWGVHDSINDIVAMKALFPVVISAANLLNTDTTLVTQLQAAIPKIPDYLRSNFARTQLLSASNDASGTTILVQSIDLTASVHNVENNDLEPVWPYNLITDNGGSLTDLGRRTFSHRINVNANDWNWDAVQAARLGLPSDFQTSVVNIVSSYQNWANGTGIVCCSFNSPYDELDGDVANAVQEALVQDYDGLLRIAPAWPSNWDVDGTVYIQGNSKVNVQIRSGQIITVVVEAGTTQNILTRNPWSGQSVRVIDSASGSVVVAPTTASQFTIPAVAGHAYIIELVSTPNSSLTYAQITANPATAPRSMGTRTIGVP